MAESQGAQPYGPNTPVIRRFLQHLAACSAAECQAAAARFESLQTTITFDRADGALADAVAATAREGARDALVGPIAQLLSAHAAQLVDEENIALRQSTLERMTEAALSAALALLVRDTLSAVEFETLYSPYAELIPLPRLEPSGGRAG